jgi:hypothetical protein
MKKITILAITLSVLILVVGSYFVYANYYVSQKQIACTEEAKLCSDGSAVGRVGPKCEFAPCPDTITYRNEEFGFEIIPPKSWQGYSIEKQTWQGLGTINGQQIERSGTKIIIKNPQTTLQQIWQDIPILIFTKDDWLLASNERGCGPEEKNCGVMAVSAAPIGPAKIGENAKYIFATPPRWYGFTDAIGWEEAVKIVKTFKAF